ncbi:MAG: TatD family hydrolase [Acetobacterales bacterium]
MLVDSHCHLDYPELSGDLGGVVSRARAADVGAMVTICTRPSELDRVLALTEGQPGIFCANGVHPHHAADEPEYAVGDLVRMADHPRIVGMGETGLDYHYDNSPRDVQQRSFRTHIAAARATGLPLIVHTRDADPDTIAILSDEAASGSFPGLIHCFSTSRELAEKAVELGLYISLSGLITFKKLEDLRGIVRDLPLDRLLVETDAPYLAPEPKRGRPNEPSYVAYTAARLADIRGVSVERIAEATTENFRRLFTRASLPAAVGD